MIFDDILSMENVCRFLSDPALDGRYPRSEGHETAKVYLRDLVERLGMAPLFPEGWFQPVLDGERVIGENIGGVRQGPGDRYLLLAAHYDHFKGIAGADDNAAAIAVLVECFRLLGDWQGQHHLALCFFDLEEPPYFQTQQMGSVQFVQRCPFDLTLLDCAVVLDLCGHDLPIPGRENGLFVLGAENSGDLVDAVRSAHSSVISPYMFANERIGDMSDHHAFRLARKPFLFLSCGWWEHYHQPTDTFDQLNIAKMHGIAGWLQSLIEALDGRAVRLGPGREFSLIEADSLQRLMGGALPLVLDGSISEVIRLLWR
jgi:hypothetical protein